MTSTLVLGAVAYDAKVVPIWDGFRAWFRSHGLSFDYVLYSNYERQVEAHLAGHVDVAWNSPLAWVRARRLAEAADRRALAVAMRDTDQDLTSVVLTRSDSTITDVASLNGRRIATGAVDSPQATLIPLAHLRGLGVTAEIRRFEVGVGLHGDHIGGERDAVRALLAGEVDAACVIDGNHLAFGRDGTIPSGAVRVVTETPRYDHCVFTVFERAVDPALLDRFRGLLLSMSYDDANVRPLLDLEGLKAWRPGRTDGFAQLEAAVDLLAFYDASGQITAEGYLP
ncbi:MAG: hypothetical protein EB084_05990 [Proteobacteria bacterium]|nr:hypothetical protein [Pseudomonadota bacterium]